jgi:hypothetical protein
MVLYLVIHRLIKIYFIFFQDVNNNFLKSKFCEAQSTLHI